MADPLFIDLDDAGVAAALARAPDRHGFMSGFAPADGRVEAGSARVHQNKSVADLGGALVHSKAADGRVGRTAAGEAAWTPGGNAKPPIAALGNGEGEAVHLRIRRLLLACVWFELDRRRAELHLDGASADALARRAADAAYTAVVARLGDYHGQSRFTTWLAKFAIHEAAAAARRHRANDRPLEGG